MTKEQVQKMYMPAMPKKCMMGCEITHNSPDRIGKKISILMHEGKPQKQAEAMAINMDKEHRLTESGGYIRAKKGRRNG